MGTAFQITPEDIYAVLTVNPQRISDRYLNEHGLSTVDLMALSDQLLKDVISPHDGEIEKAALFGLDIDEQTIYAQNEISGILYAEGLFIKNHEQT